MRTARQRNDASIVDHLGKNHRVVAGLEQLKIVVIAIRDYWGSGAEPQNAALVYGSVFGAVRGSSHSLSTGSRPLLPFRRQRRKSAVRWIDNQRCSLVVDDFCSKVKPELVVGTRVSWRRRGIDASFSGSLFKGGCLFIGQDLFCGEVSGPLQGCKDAKIPHTFKVGLALRCTRR